MRRGFGFAGLVVGVALILCFFTTTSTAKTFNCSVKTTCRALIDYVPNTTTTYTQIQTLFGVKNFRSLLGANNLSNATTSPNSTVPAKQPIKIPFRCGCANGTGASRDGPDYIVQKGDDLDHIASGTFGRLVKYEEIAATNGIPNPNDIKVGQKLQIPLPCSCDKVGGSDVVHYGHVVAAESSVERIAEEYGADMATLLQLNGIADPKTLQAGDVLDVPLKACTSMVGKGSSDYPLLVPNNTYVFTAQNCVMCKCDAANNWTLHCQSSQLPPADNSSWPVCPAARCEGSTSLLLGNTSGDCAQSCTYAGYTSKNILTALSNATASTCPSAAPGSNDTAMINLRGLNWSLVFICIHLVLLCVFVR